MTFPRDENYVKIKTCKFSAATWMSSSRQNILSTMREPSLGSGTEFGSISRSRIVSAKSIATEKIRFSM